MLLENVWDYPFPIRRTNGHPTCTSRGCARKITRVLSGPLLQHESAARGTMIPRRPQVGP